MDSANFWEVCGPKTAGQDDEASCETAKEVKELHDINEIKTLLSFGDNQKIELERSSSSGEKSGKSRHYIDLMRLLPFFSRCAMYFLCVLT